MSPTPAQRGYAFEYANIRSALDVFNCEATPETIDWCKTKGEKYFNKLPKTMAKEMETASIELMNFFENLDDDIFDCIFVEKTGEKSGKKDVTDIRFFNEKRDKEVGISLKSNHDAARHQRVSPRIDIGEEWLGVPADEQYWNDIRDTFNNLEEYCDRNDIIKFKELGDKKNELLYKPACDAVANYLNRAFNKYGEKVMKNLIIYLVGEKDFYKAKANFNKKRLVVKSYNLRGELNAGEQLPLPTNCLEVSAAKSSRGTPNRVRIILDNGWNINMRIHTASSKVESSLKFDTQLIDSPAERWEKKISL
ncbi:HaeIII family restriction endonuclease [Natroniella acetigena]|uniref:HaeIII family restriction endonuclease n=1 Tax=Natroniella acetigena TaxID=52004 RepID=UPI00200AD7AB|nr:HaeIII family restriction endonuclease [Natroniella acetigena]MCK8828545.1 HaeIII family restriction endonuclease [Natroniella acetigena]